MPDKIVNHLRDLLCGGPRAPAYAPEGLLKERGLSVERLARAAGLSRTSIYFYIVNKKRPTPESLHRICAALQIPFDEGLSYCTPSKVGPPYRNDSA
jgi:transcriptional regulator with XRE-family HTH domain